MNKSKQCFIVSKYGTGNKNKNFCLLKKENETCIQLIEM